MHRRISAVLAAFEGAGTPKEYRAAKRLGEKLGPLEQMALVDAMLDAHRRCF